MPDIDIDFIDREQVLGLFKTVSASRLEEGKLVKHNTGVYLHEVPFDPINNTCSIPYEEAENQGLFKIDFLNVSLYKGIRDEKHLIKLMETEPLWELLTHKEFSDQLFHVGGHSTVLQTMKPRCVAELAAVLAMIRPAKRHLIGKGWKEVMKEVWTKPDDDSYYFKKSHATAYAVAITVQMNLICEQLSQGKK